MWRKPRRVHVPGIDGDDGHPFLHAGPDEQRIAARVAHGLVHERVPLDEIEAGVVELPAVGRARPGPGGRRVGHREPVGVGAGLALEGALVEGVPDVAEPEGADCAPGDGVVGSREDAVDEFVSVAHVHHLAGRRLDLQKFEGHVAGDGAIEARLQERRPLVLEFVRAARVVLAHACHAREYGLWEKDTNFDRSFSSHNAMSRRSIHQSYRTYFNLAGWGERNSQKRPTKKTPQTRRWKFFLSPTRTPLPAVLFVKFISFRCLL